MTTAPAPYTYHKLLPDVEPCITDANHRVICDMYVRDDMDATGALLEAAPDLRDLATLVRDMRMAQKAYYAKRVPPSEKRDLLIASRELEVKVDKATVAVLAKIGGDNGSH
jgi:hypothetical protein